MPNAATEQGRTVELGKDSLLDRAPDSLAETRKAHHGLGFQWIAPRLPASRASRESREKPRTGLSATTIQAVVAGPELGEPGA